MADGPDAGTGTPAAYDPGPDAFDVPAGEEPAARCPYCDRPFARERFRDLHVGEVHADGATAPERERYESARENEDDDLFVFHLKVVAAIVVVIMGYVYLYGFVLS